MDKKWIYNFNKISKKHKDISDYERYYLFCKKYLENHQDEHKEIFKVLIDTLNSTKSTILLSIAYRLIFNLNIDLNLNTNLVKSHFKNKVLKRYLFPVFTKAEIFLDKKKILKMLYDETYEDKYFLEYLKNYPDLIESFLVNENAKYIRKQLLCILNTKYFYNMDYYIKFLGDCNNHIAFLAYEVFTLLISFRGSQNLYKSFEIVQNVNTYIDIKNKIQIDSIDNFLIYFLPFMKTKQEIYRLILENKINEINHFLKNYYIKTSGILLQLKNIRFYSIELPSIKSVFNDLIFDSADEDFEFLFAESNYKSISDCIEF